MDNNGSGRRLSAKAICLGLALSAPLFSVAQAGNGDSLAERFAEAELVAQVQISAIHRDVDNALSEPGMVAISGYVYAATSMRVWKGKADGLIAFRLGLESCDKKLEKGARYLIFATPDSQGRLYLRGCDAVLEESEAAPLLARLNQFQLQG